MNFKISITLILISIISSFAFSGTAFAASDDKIIILYTNSGPLVIEFFPDDAPDTVENFLKKYPEKKIAFVHFDMDTYNSTSFVLKKINNHLQPD